MYQKQVYEDLMNRLMDHEYIEAPQALNTVLYGKPFGEPAPIPNNNTPVWELVMEDMKARNQFGIEKYGTPLQAFNGRNALKDAYEEVLDLAVYLRTAMEEGIGGA